MTKNYCFTCSACPCCGIFVNGYSVAAGVGRDNQLEKDEANTEATIGLILYCKKLQKLCL